MEPIAALRTVENDAYLEQVSLTQIARQFGTPTYVYSSTEIENRYRAFEGALGGHPHLICYAVKACPNIAVLNLLGRCGSGFDIVSGGELERVIRAGSAVSKTVFSGVGKAREEIENALQAGIRCLNIESVAELKMVEAVAASLGRVAPIALRVNPDVDADTHIYITTGMDENKFGVALEDAQALYRYAAASESLKPLGVGCHIGSQISRLGPFEQAAQSLLAFVDRLLAQGLAVEHIDFGGGLGIGAEVPTPEEYVNVLLKAVADRPLEVWIEPGRAIVGAAGLLLTRVLYLKSGRAKNFVVVDAAMNDLLRPALYQAEHPIVTIGATKAVEQQVCDIVGPVCESGDFLAQNCTLMVSENDLLAVLMVGAYGFSMASNYNSRGRPAEILVSGETPYLVRRRETVADLMRGERVGP